MTLAMMTNAGKYDWPTWMLGIMRSFISGGSSAMVSGLASIGIAPDKFNFTGNLGNTLKLMGVMFLFQGGYRMFEFLQLHGAPDQLQATLEKASVATKQAASAVAEAKAIAPESPKQNGG
jgi:hypothetical protein